MSKLEEIIERLVEEIRILKSENETLRLENAELKEKLGLTSKNSSLPSSKELYKLKRNKPKSDRKVGGQVGHNGVRRQKMLADKIMQVPLAVQCGCGGEIALSKTAYIHQKVDLPKIKPYVCSRISVYNMVVAEDAVEERQVGFQKELRQIHSAQMLSQ